MRSIIVSLCLSGFLFPNLLWNSLRASASFRVWSLRVHFFCIIELISLDFWIALFSKTESIIPEVVEQTYNVDTLNRVENVLTSGLDLKACKWEVNFMWIITVYTNRIISYPSVSLSRFVFWFTGTKTSFSIIQFWNSFNSWSI